jgi:hypothetical protein
MLLFNFKNRVYQAGTFPVKSPSNGICSKDGIPRHFCTQLQVPSIASFDMHFAFLDIDTGCVK